MMKSVKLRNHLNRPVTPWWVIILLTFALVVGSTKANADNFVSFHESNEAQTSLDCLAEAMFYEARGEEKIGMFLVGEVIRERVEDEVYEFRSLNSYCEVIHQPSRDSQRPWLCAFSYYCDGLPEVYNADNIKEVESMKLAYEMAQRIIYETVGTRLNLSGNALYYTQHKVSQGWMDQTVITLVFKGHTFRKPLEEKEKKTVWPKSYSEAHYEDFVEMNTMSQGHYFEQVEADYIQRELYNTVGITGYGQMLERYKKENNRL